MLRERPQKGGAPAMSKGSDPGGPLSRGSQSIYRKRLMNHLPRYCQFKPDLTPTTRGTRIMIAGKSTDYVQASCLFRVEFSLS